MFTRWLGLVLVAMPIAALSALGLSIASGPRAEGDDRFLILFVALPLTSAALVGLRMCSESRSRWRFLGGMAALAIAPTLAIVCVYSCFFAILLFAAVILKIEGHP